MQCSDGDLDDGSSSEGSVRLAAVDEGSGVHDLSSDEEEGLPAVVTMMPPMTVDPVADGLVAGDDGAEHAALAAQYTAEAPAVCLLHANVELPAEEAVHLADKGKPPLMLDHGQDKHACFKVCGAPSVCPCSLLQSRWPRLKHHLLLWLMRGLSWVISCFDHRCCSRCYLTGPWQQRLTCATH